jgi:hypothetical protein
MKRLSLIGPSLVAVAFFSGCGKSGGSSNLDNTSVYIAGFDNGNIVYWKDGQENVIGKAGLNFNGNSTGIAVLHQDVYVAGYVGDTAVYWKNGVETYLSDRSKEWASATDMTISGLDVYIAGWVVSNDNQVVYWKNGVRTVVAASNSSITGTSIAAVGDDVYVSATIGTDTAVYWKNGIRTTLGHGQAVAFDIAVDGTDVYVVGLYNQAPVYWKNGTQVTLPHTGIAGTSRVTISAGDVYISGIDNGNAVYWKNGSETILGSGNANAISCSGSDVYVTGWGFATSPLTYYGAYWDNGSLHSFGRSQGGTQATTEGTAITLSIH